MGQVVVWGNGDVVTGRFKVPAGKTAVSANSEAQQGGIRVDWGGGDVVILPGENWAAIPTKLTSWQFKVRTATQNIGLSSSSLGFFLLVVNRFGDIESRSSTTKSACTNPWYEFPPEPSYDLVGVSNSSGNRLMSSFSKPSLEISGNMTPGYAPDPCTLTTGSGEDYPKRYFFVMGNQLRAITILGTFLWSGTRGIVEIKGLKRIAAQGNLWTITTNVGAIATKEQQEEPDISSENTPCKVKINYADNSNQEIVLTNCADWARIENDDQCPPGSCECTHRAYKCCIGSNGQVIKKIRL